MSSRLKAPLLCLFVFSLGCPGLEGRNQDQNAAGAAVEAAEEPLVAARLGDETITLAELDEWIKEDLFERQTAGRSPSKVYDLRSQALERMITERIVGGEASRRDMTEEEFIEAEVAAMGEIPDEEVAKFYEENIERMGGKSLEEISPRVREYLEGNRARDVVNQLRERADVAILLEPYRVDIAADGPSKGPDEAPVTIIAFSDFQCPFCGRVPPVINELLERYPDQLRFVYRHLPLDRIHSRARAAAEASLCAHDQNQFWPYHDKLFANSKALSDEDLKKYAEELNLNVEEWEQCMADGKFKDKVDEDVAAAESIGVSGTPAFVVNGVVLSGAKPVEAFVSLIDSELERSKSPESS